MVLFEQACTNRAVINRMSKYLIRIYNVSPSCIELADTSKQSWPLVSLRFRINLYVEINDHDVHILGAVRPVNKLRFYISGL